MSAAAIGLAMLTTLIEKLCVTSRIKQVEELCQLLDSLFEGGAGEEYLARLVKAGESSATQTAQLKDALVSDLKEMLTEIIHQQTEAIAGSFSDSSKAQIVTTEQSGDRIAQAISDSLSEPLQKIASAVNTTTDTNGEAVNRVLNEVLITFSQQMKEMFGGQMGDISLLLQQTTTAMQSTVSRFDQLANNLGDAGKNAADVMSERLSTALESMESRQLTLNNTMIEFVSQLRDMVKTSQSETNVQIQHALDVMSEKITAMAGQLEQQATYAADTHTIQQEQLAHVASTLTNDLTTQVKSMIEQTNNAISSMQAAVTSIRDVTKDNTQRMENSAGTLALAADNFAQAGISVSGVMQQTSTVSDKMATTSIALNNSANTVQTALNDYTNAGKMMAQMVEELKATVEVAKNEASISQSLVDQIKQSAEHLLQAQSSVDGIFKDVCDELANAHEEFASNVVKGLKSSNTAYQKELKDAVDYLKSAIEELGEVAEKIPARG
jgi:hypothetical protein